MASCLNCSYSYYKCIAVFYENNKKSLEILRHHGVLPKEVICPRCNNPCVYADKRRVWRCNRSGVVAKTKKRWYCNYSVADCKGSFAGNTKLPPWKIIIFVNHFLSHLWDHRTMVDCLSLSPKSSVRWWSFCCEITEDWFHNQEPIGGEGLGVQIDQTLIVRRKDKIGRALAQSWLFGGIERGGRKRRRFIVPLARAIGEKGDEEILLPLIKKYVRHGSVIYSDSWAAYKISDMGYKHFNQSEEDSIHKESKERLWGDVKEWVKRPNIWSKYLDQHLARYLFICSVEHKENLLHEFFIHAAKVFEPLSDRQPGDKGDKDSDEIKEEPEDVDEEENV